MSLQRTPPKEYSGSAPDLSDACLGSGNTPLSCISNRQDKRKRGDVYEEDLRTVMMDMKRMISTVTDDQQNKFTVLHSSIEEIKQQNNNICKALEFMTEKYEEMRIKFENSEKERVEALTHIKNLESRVEHLEKAARSTSIEIRNIPSTKFETKEELINIIKNVGETIQTEITKNDIKDVFRYPSRSSAKMPIVVDFCSVLKRDAVLQAVKKFKEDWKTNLTTNHVKVTGPNMPVYISESLTARAKKVFALARKFASENGYKYCWTSHGLVYIRKEEGSRAIRLSNEEDIARLLCK